MFLGRWRAGAPGSPKNFTPPLSRENVAMRATTRRLRIPRPVRKIALAALVGCSSDAAVSTSKPDPAVLTAIAGNEQSGDPGTELPAALSVRATTNSGTPVAGSSVLFEVTNGSATVSPATSSTDSAGIASTLLHLGALGGTIQVRASLPGTPLSATFSATARNPEPDSTLAANIYNPDWTDASHGKVTPAYATVFPQDAVNKVEILLTSAQWAGIRANMKALYGFDFGGRTQGGGQFPEDDPEYVAVMLRYNGKVWKKAGFRLKGNSTLSTAWGQGNYKLPFRIKLNEFEGTYPAIKNQRFYGFKELSFSPGRSDPSLIREKSAADIFRMAGVPAARTAFYRVYIDFGSGLKYCGVYTGVEVIDDTMVKDQFGEDKGNIYKPESRFQAFVAAEFEKKNNKAAADFGDVQAAIAALQSPLRTSNAAQWRTNLEAVFNVDHFLKWLAVDNGIVNWDSYGAIAHNYYLYNHSTRKLLWIPWDHNESMTGSPGIVGTTGGGQSRTGLSLSMNEVSAGWPLIRYLIDDPVYVAQYKAHLKRLNNDVLSQPGILAMLDRYHALISPFVVGPNGEQVGYTYLANAAAFTNALPSLKAHVQNRVALISTYVP